MDADFSKITELVETYNQTCNRVKLAELRATVTKTIKKNPVSRVRIVNIFVENQTDPRLVGLNYY